MLAVGLIPGHTYSSDIKMKAACIMMHWGGMDCRISIANGPLIATRNVSMKRETEVGYEATHKSSLVPRPPTWPGYEANIREVSMSKPHTMSEMSMVSKMLCLFD